MLFERRKKRSPIGKDRAKMFESWKPKLPETTKPRLAADGETKPSGRMRALAAEESRIEHGLSHFLQVGEALKAIRDKQLYANNRETEYLSWVDYLSKRWHMTESHASRLMSAAEVVQELAHRGHTILPTTESQARPLAALNADQAAAAWAEVVATTPTDAITAAAIEEKVLKYRKPRRNRNRKPAAVKLKGKGWKLTIERTTATIDVEAILAEALERLKPAKADAA